MKQNLQRQASSERLSSPEQLDQLMQVTNPTGWLALIGLCSILITVVIWGMIGSILTKVVGQGILLKRGGIFDVVSLGSGQLLEMKVKVGDTVQVDQTVAVIAQPEQAEQIKSAWAEMQELDAEHQNLALFYAKDNPIQQDYWTKEQVNLEEIIAKENERLKWLNERITAQENMLRQGLITERTLVATKEDFNATKRAVETARNELMQIDSRKLTLKMQRERDLMTSQQKIDAAKRKVELLENQLAMASKVASPYRGRVLEIRVDEGNWVANGATLISLEALGEEPMDLEAVLYISPYEGKKIRPEMEVNIALSTVKQEEFGVLLGRVRAVAEFPSTYQGMMRVLSNDQLVKTLSAGGAPIEVHADLIPDSTTINGYRWSSGDGPPNKIYSGTLCSAKVTIRRQAPISLVIPYLRESFGL